MNIEEHINWKYISTHQKLSEDFIREFQDKISWNYISCNQKLSDDFIREFKDKIEWFLISKFQILSKKFIEEFKDKVNINNQLKAHHYALTLIGKKEIVKEYCKKYDLKYDDKYFYAFRNHDINGSGIYNKTIKYKKNKYYRDWRCDLNPKQVNSFGFGIFSEGNTKVKVKIEDLGCRVNKSNKLRVWGFEII